MEDLRESVSADPYAGEACGWLATGLGTPKDSLRSVIVPFATSWIAKMLLFSVTVAGFWGKVHGTKHSWRSRFFFHCPPKKIHENPPGPRRHSVSKVVSWFEPRVRMRRGSGPNAEFELEGLGGQSQEEQEDQDLPLNLRRIGWLWLSKPFWDPILVGLSVNSPPILEPILLGIGMFTQFLR